MSCERAPEGRHRPTAKSDGFGLSLAATTEKNYGTAPERTCDVPDFRTVPDRHRRDGDVYRVGDSRGMAMSDRNIAIGATTWGSQ